MKLSKGSRNLKLTSPETQHRSCLASKQTKKYTLKLIDYSSGDFNLGFMNKEKVSSYDPSVCNNSKNGFYLYLSK